MSDEESIARARVFLLMVAIIIFLVIDCIICLGALEVLIR